MARNSLRGARVVIIGGTSGIGLGVAECALGEGATVILGSSNPANIDAAITRLGGSASGHPIDVKDETSIAGFFDKAGAFDHLVYTAGDWAHSAGSGPIAAIDLKSVARGYDVRYWGALACIKHAQGRLAAEGSITVTDGVLAHRPRKGAAVMSSMLGGLEHLVRALAVELAPQRVNIVCPGIVMTERWKRLPEEQLKAMTKAQPLPRGGEPAEIAEAYLYLMRAGFTTGQVLVVDGGRTLV